MVIPGSNRVNTQQIFAISDFDTDISGTAVASASETDGDSFRVKKPVQRELRSPVSHCFGKNNQANTQDCYKALAKLVLMRLSQVHLFPSLTYCKI